MLGDKVTLIDSGRATALYTAELLRSRGLETTKETEGEYRFFVSDTPHNFENMAGMFLSRDIHHRVTQIDIEEY